MTLDLDLDTSTVTIAGRRFPAVGLMCPCNDPECDHAPYFDHMLGQAVPHSPWNFMDVYIPAESGLLIHIEVNDQQPGFAVHLNSVTCELDTCPGDRRIWLPMSVSAVDGRIGYYLKGRRTIMRGAWFWEGADPEWVVELIDRMASHPYDEPEGPRCQIIRLADLVRFEHEYQSKLV